MVMRPLAGVSFFDGVLDGSGVGLFFGYKQLPAVTPKA
jgi:hypothetical protein